MAEVIHQEDKFSLLCKEMAHKIALLASQVQLPWQKHQRYPGVRNTASPCLDKQCKGEKTRAGAIQQEGKGGLPEPQQEEGHRLTLIDTDS